jgi:hypothetical protein
MTAPLHSRRLYGKKGTCTLTISLVAVAVAVVVAVAAVGKWKALYRIDYQFWMYVVAQKATVNLVNLQIFRRAEPCRSRTECIKIRFQERTENFSDFVVPVLSGTLIPFGSVSLLSIFRNDDGVSSSKLLPPPRVLPIRNWTVVSLGVKYNTAMDLSRVLLSVGNTPTPFLSTTGAFLHQPRFFGCSFHKRHVLTPYLHVVLYRQV